MKASKLASIMACFSKEEWSNLGHFLKLPYLNKVHKKHREIYEYLKTYYWLQKKRKTDSKTLFPSSDTLNSKFFPDAKDFKPLNKHLSTLHKNARLFLASEKAMNTPLKVELVSINRAMSSKKYHYAEVAIKRVLTEMEQETDDWFLRYQFAMTNSKLHLVMHGSRDRTSFLRATENNLDDFYIIPKLKNYCQQVGIQQSFNNFETSENQKIFEDYVNSYYSKTSYRPIIFQVYYHIMNILRGRQVQSSMKTIDYILSANKDMFSPLELKEVQVFLLNHCAHLLHSQKMTYSEVFITYQMLLDSGILRIKEGSFKLGYYLNILILAIRTEAFIWLKEKFIPVYTKMLLPEYQKTAGDYGKAEYYLSQKDWKKAFDYAYEIPSRDMNFKFLRGAVLIQAAYEIEKADLKGLSDLYDTTTTIQNFKAQLTYKKIKVTREVKAYKNFVRFTQRIYNLEKARNKQERAVKLKNLIQQEKMVARKVWLNEILKEYLV